MTRGAIRSVYRLATQVPLLAKVADLPLMARARRSVREAALVEEPIRYAAVGILEPRGLHRFKVRSTGRDVWLGRGDSWVFNEIFGARIYDLPAAVDAALGPQPVVADLGANVGLFGAFILFVRPDARVIGYEPDPHNVNRLRKNLAWSIESAQYELIEAAAANRAGSAAFSAALGGRSHLGLGAEGHAIEVRLDDVLPLLGHSDLAKIDIEGGEWPLLQDPRLRTAGPKAIALEYHPLGCPASDTHATARELLTAAGYEEVPPARAHMSGEFPDGQGMVWAVRADR